MSASAPDRFVCESLEDAAAQTEAANVRGRPHPLHLRDPRLGVPRISRRPAGRRAVEVDKAVKRDPRLRAAWDVWSRCMAEGGFTRYPDPVAAFADDAWDRGSNGNTRHRDRCAAVLQALRAYRADITDVLRKPG